MKKIALIYNFAQHYRTNIFTLLDKELGIDFYFGDDMGDVKKMDYSLLKNKVVEVKNNSLFKIEWQSNVVGLAFKRYESYIMLGSPMNLSTWICSILARLFGKKVFFWTHGWYGKESNFEKILKKIFFRIPSKILLYGNYAKDLMIKEGFNSDKLLVIHNSLLYDKQIKIRETLKLNDIYNVHFKNHLPTVVFVGRLTPVKKLDQLLQAQSIWGPSNVKFNVVFIGDGSEKPYLENLVASLNIQQYVWFYGPSYNEEELSNLLYNADLCVAPGNIGLTAMHALVYGCPCISHNDFKWQMPEFEAIKPGVTGDFFERDNIESLANVINRWLSENINKRDFVRNACFKEIDDSWNPYYQLEIIRKALK